MSRNNVRGPTSALTEFLRESGITPTTIARRRATQNPPEAGPSNAGHNGAAESGGEAEGEEGDGEPTRPASRRRTRANATSGYVSDELDEPEAPTTKKRKLTKAAEAKLKAKEKEKAKKKAKKDGDDEDYDEDEDAYTVLSKSMWTNGASSSSKPPVGNFENCAKCEKQFTVTKYTMAANPGPGFLCHPCAKASGADPFKKPALPKKRKAPADKRTVVNFEEKRFPTLVSICIQIVTRHINDVEALGDIGAINMNEISKAISKNRSLTSENAHLFYGAHNTSLTLYDATNLSPTAFSTLAHLNPNLTTLRLDLCGCMDDTVMATWNTSLPALTHLELLGPFLVRVPAWKQFFESHPQLEAFLITQSPRFDLECMESLVTHCKGLKEVRLKEIGKMEDGFLPFLKKLEGHLTSLDLSDPTVSCSEDAVIELMKAVGPTLTHLNLSKHNLLTDAFLEEGLKPHVRVLTSLTLSHLPELTDEGVAGFFDTWSEAAGSEAPNPPLTSLDLSRNHELSSAALVALLKHSGHTLQTLNINGWRSTSDAALGNIARVSKDLRWLDVGWCREMDNFLMKELMEKCLRVKEIKVWGCNRMTETCPRKRGVSIYGIESHSVH